MSPTPHLPISLEIPVAWGEQDLFGHLNNVVYFRHMENVRMYLLERIGALRSHKEKGQGVILAATECRFLQPVEWPMTLTIRTGVTAVGNTSFTMTYETVDTAGNKVAEGTSVQVMYDYAKGEKMPVPEDIRQRIADLRTEHIRP